MPVHRTVDPLDDLLTAVIRLCEPHRHRLGLDDHVSGPRPRCPECRVQAYLALEEIVAERARRGDPVALEAIDPAGLGRGLVRRRHRDGLRKQRVRDGLPARSRQVARAKVVQVALAAAATRGELPIGVDEATELLFRGVEFLTTSGDRSEPGSPMPFHRMGRGLARDGGDLSREEAAASWDAVERALVATPEGIRHHDRNIGRHSHNLAVVDGVDHADARSLHEVDPQVTWLDAVEVEATAMVHRGEATASEALADIIDRDQGSRRRGPGRLSATVQEAAPEDWLEAVRRIERAAHQG